MLLCSSNPRCHIYPGDELRASYRRDQGTKQESPVRCNWEMHTIFDPHERYISRDLLNIYVGVLNTLLRHTSFGFFLDPNVCSRTTSGMRNVCTEETHISFSSSICRRDLNVCSTFLLSVFFCHTPLFYRKFFSVLVLLFLPLRFAMFYHTQIIIQI